MAKRFKKRELQQAYLSNLAGNLKERTWRTILLSIVSVGAMILLDAAKKDEATNDDEIFRD